MAILFARASQSFLSKSSCLQCFNTNSDSKEVRDTTYKALVGLQSAYFLERMAVLIIACSYIVGLYIPYHYGSRPARDNSR